jgi:hypothetical protein
VHYDRIVAVTSSGSLREGGADGDDRQLDWAAISQTRRPLRGPIREPGRGEVVVDGCHSRASAHWLWEAGSPPGEHRGRIRPGVVAKTVRCQAGGSAEVGPLCPGSPSPGRHA